MEMLNKKVGAMWRYMIILKDRVKIDMLLTQM